MQGSQPPFIVGLKSAKKVLVQLRDRKLKQQQINQHSSPLRRSSSKAQQASSSKNYTNKSQLQVIEPEHATHKVKTKELRQKINIIGSQLFECYCQNQSYEIILNHLVNHYAQNRHIVEENEKLKRKAYEYHQNIEDYKERIRKNYLSIEQHQKQVQQIKTRTAEQLRAFLLVEAQKAQQKAHENIPTCQYSISKQQNYQQPQSQLQKQSKITLRFQNLSKQVVRKPVRKTQPQDDEIRRSFYHSELYTL